MKRLASEVLRDLEIRVANLESRASRPGQLKDMTIPFVHTMKPETHPRNIALKNIAERETFNRKFRPKAVSKNVAEVIREAHRQLERFGVSKKMTHLVDSTQVADDVYYVYSNLDQRHNTLYAIIRADENETVFELVDVFRNLNEVKSEWSDWTYSELNTSMIKKHVK
tara:strand:- start:3027 stop:3530 length:504 start_codon:yes stop_codon:yes gene_type:complete